MGVGEPEPLDALLARLTAQKAEIGAARPLPEPTLRSLLDDFALRYAHETTALEGNTLSLSETQVVLEHGIAIGGKTVGEHIEVLNVPPAWERVQTAVRARTPLTEDLLLDVHRIVMRGLLGDDAGRYRRHPVYILGATHVPPNWGRVPDRMAAFVRDFAHRPAQEHPIRFAARAHVAFEGIHPFPDGNGRTGRLLVNFMLLWDGHPPALYTATERSAYLAGIRAAQRREQPDHDPITRVTADATQFMINRYLQAIAMCREGEGQAPPIPEHNRGEYER